MAVKKEFERFGILPNIRQSGGMELQLRCLVRFFRAVWRELKSKQGLPWKQRLRAWRMGFTSESWFLYNLADNDPGQYLGNLFSTLRTYKINGFFNPVIGNKLVLSRLAAAHGIPHPEVVSIIIDGRLIDDGGPTNPDMAQTIANTLDRHPHQVFRPTWSGAGEGIFFLSRIDGGLKINGIEVTLHEVCALLSKLDRYLSTVFVEQAEYASRIFPDTANTLRILTLWDIESDEPFIAAVSHRFGSSRSLPIDNWHQGHGGFCASVDLETSTLGQAAVVSQDKQLVWHSYHPETKEPIEGVKIPGLAKCLEGLLVSSRHFPFCPFIGWDVILTKDGYSVLEANSLPGLKVWQVHKPLLVDPRTRQFFQHWGLVRTK